MRYTDEGQQGRCMSPGAVARSTVDRLIEQAEEQWEMQDHPGWDIFEDDGACEASPVGPSNGRVQLLFHILSVFQPLLHCLLIDNRIHNTGLCMSTKAVHMMMLRCNVQVAVFGMMHHCLLMLQHHASTSCSCSLHPIVLLLSSSLCAVCCS